MSVIEEQPLLALGIATGVGALVGGLLVPGVARFAFAAALGYGAAELRDREGGLDLRDMLDRLSSDGESA